MFALDFNPAALYSNAYTNTQGGFMFSPDFYIDNFQNTKKVVTNAIFKDSRLNKAAHAYIDAQTAFAKVLSNNTIEMTRYSVDSISAVLFPKKAETSSKV